MRPRDLLFPRTGWPGPSLLQGPGGDGSGSPQDTGGVGQRGQEDGAHRALLPQSRQIALAF